MSEDDFSTDPIFFNNNMDTVDLLVQFTSYHEGLHSGIIKTLKNIL